MYQGQILLLYLLFLFFQLSLKLRKLPILKLRRPFPVIALLGRLDLPVYFLDLFTQSAQPFHGMLLVIPLGFFIVKLITKFCKFFLKRFQTLLA